MTAVIKSEVVFKEGAILNRLYRFITAASFAGAFSIACISSYASWTVVPTSFPVPSSIKEFSANRSQSQSGISVGALNQPRTAKAERAAKPVAKRISKPLERIRVTSKFGQRVHPITKKPSFHGGTDFAAKLNDKVYSVASGVVVRAGTRGALGNSVEVIDKKSNLRTIFGHLNKVAVRSGQTVTAGDVVGFAGTTGRSTGVHLHLITKSAKTGTLFNPTKVLASAITKTPAAANHTSSFELAVGAKVKEAEAALATIRAKQDSIHAALGTQPVDKSTPPSHSTGAATSAILGKS